MADACPESEFKGSENTHGYHFSPPGSFFSLPSALGFLATLFLPEVGSHVQTRLPSDVSILLPLLDAGTTSVGHHVLWPDYCTLLILHNLVTVNTCLSLCFQCCEETPLTMATLIRENI